MNPAHVTPLILTFNEEANLARALAPLHWAERIVVVDSFSTDGTLEILEAHPAVEVYQRPFDSFAAQCNFGLEQVASPWVLSLDADYVCPVGLLDEIRSLPDEPEEHGFAVSFRYLIDGRPLRGTLYPPRTVLYRRDSARYRRDGHAHRVEIDGPVGRLRSVIDHDDRKPLDSWFDAQRRYAREEAEKLLGTSARELGFVDRLRLRKWIAPLLTPAYCLFVKGGVLDGRAGIQYALQRTYAEIALSLSLYGLESTAPAPIEDAAGQSAERVPAAEPIIAQST